MAGSSQHHLSDMRRRVRQHVRGNVTSMIEFDARVDERARAAQLMADSTCTGTDECLCLACMAANDAALAKQDAFTALMDESGLCRLAHAHRASRRVIWLDRMWARYLMTVFLVGERPITAPPVLSRPWERRDAYRDDRQGFARYVLAAPDWSLLGDSPERVSDRYED